MRMCGCADVRMGGSLVKSARKWRARQQMHCILNSESCLPASRSEFCIPYLAPMLITNIKGLLQVRQRGPVAGKDMSDLPLIENAWLRIENGKIDSFGEMHSVPEYSGEHLAASGRYVLPSWVDSHTHLVFAATREGEFVDRINGMSYQEIAERGGGILNSAARLREMEEEELYEASLQRLLDVKAMGTGAIEIKSGYGLTLEAELKMLRVVRRLKEARVMPIRATFLGAHAVPPEYNGDAMAWTKHAVDKILPRVVDEGLADYVDAFCEQGYFGLEETELLLEAGVKAGLKPKVHVNQFNAFGGVELCARYGAVSVDHLEEMNPEDYDALADSNTLPVALPLCSMFLSIPYTPGREIIDRDLPLVLASDYNPGSAPSGNMNLAVALACIKMKLNPEEAINAATINGAAALEWQDQLGSIEEGKRANLIITKPVSHYHLLPYSFGETLIEKVIVSG